MEALLGLAYFCFCCPLKEARSLFSPHRFQWDPVIACSVRTMTPQRDLDCSLVSLPLFSRLDAHPGGMWFVSRYKTSPLKNYITSTGHNGLARGRGMLLLVQLPSEISSVSSMQLETASPELTCVHLHMCPRAAALFMCKHTDTLAYRCTEVWPHAYVQRQKLSCLSVCSHTCANSNLGLMLAHQLPSVLSLARMHTRVHRH